MTPPLRLFQNALGGITPSQPRSQLATPELHRQSTVTMDPTAQAVRAASSNSRPVHEAMAPPSVLQEEEPGQAPPASSKSKRPPLRPGKGISGTHCMVKANHFLTELLKKDLHQYDVKINPKLGLNRAVMAQLVKRYRESRLGNLLPAYDGARLLYTAGPLPFTSGVFIVTVPDEDGCKREFTVTVELASHVNMDDLQDFILGYKADIPQKLIQLLDIVLRETPKNIFKQVRRSFFPPGHRRQLDEGLETWRGFYQSIRPTQMGLSLNVDMSTAALIPPLPVINFVTQILDRDVSAGPLSDSEREKLTKALRGIKIEVSHRGIMRREYRVYGLTDRVTQEVKFLVEKTGTTEFIGQYFLETYGLVIGYMHLPCLRVGYPEKPTYFPMEVCKIVEGQSYTRMLSKSQIRALLEVSCKRPDVRESDILKMVNQSNYVQDDYAKEFGINISPELKLVEARILPPPRLKYHDAGLEPSCLPQEGQWSMTNKKMYDGGSVSSWICINFANMSETTVNTFCKKLAETCNVLGINFDPVPVLEALTARADRFELALKARFHDVMTKLQPQKKELDIIIFILPDINGSLYGDLKRICETELGIVSQCCLAKHAKKMDNLFLSNLALKINVKIGGSNTVLHDAISMKIPNIDDVPTIIFGADVTHSHGSNPSIAAVVASQDWPEISKYASLVCAQAHRQEIIEDLYTERQDSVLGKVHGVMIRELLISFRRATGKSPQRIIFYRDGVGEGQFYEVLLRELDAIRKACESLMPGYQPPVTFVVVQKRHHTRLFPYDYDDENSVTLNRNIMPGTVVDSSICHPTEFD